MVFWNLDWVGGWIDIGAFCYLHLVISPSSSLMLACGYSTSVPPLTPLFMEPPKVS